MSGGGLDRENPDVRDPKNRHDHTLPLSDYLFDLLARCTAGAVNDSAEDVTRVVLSVASIERLP
jgi:hypothetical protein